MSSIVWTTLPVAIDPVSGNGYVSVFITPKMAETTLAFPWTNWPTVVQNATFRVNLYDQVNPDPWQTHAATVLTTVTPMFDSVLWSEIFPSDGTMAVNPFVFSDNSKRQLWSYSVDQIHENIKAAYASVQGQTPTAFPAIDWNANNALMSLINGYSVANNFRAETRQALGMQWIGKWPTRNADELAALNGPIPGSPLAGPQGTLSPLQKQVWLAKRFYDRPTATKDVHNNLNAIPVVTQPQWDFAERIAILADHPALLRRLGLVIDLQFPWNGTVNGFVQVVPTVPGFNGPPITPRTAYESSGKRFNAASGGAAVAADALDVAQGMLPLEDTSRFYVTTGDPDGTMHKTIDFASNMANIVTFTKSEAAKSNTAATPPAESLPARRNTGVTVTRKGRATVLQSRFTRVAAVESNFDNNLPANQYSLYASDVLRGYRVDVQNVATGQWSSLHKRIVQFAYNGALIPNGQVQDEGYIKSASGSSDPNSQGPNPTGPNDLYVHEKLFGWHGWSLSASRPGQTIQPDSTVGAPNNTTSDPTFPVASIVRVAPGSLPSMRYGQQYRLRARAVDLAGNSLSPDDPSINPAHVTAPITFGRVEPVPPPVLVYPTGVTEGESLEILVIRSNPVQGTDPTDGMDAVAMAAYLESAYLNMGGTNPLQFTDLNNAYKVYLPNCDRHVAPPKESQVFAEMHGDFDGAFFTGANLDSWYRLGTREEGTFMDLRIASLTDPTNDGYITNPNYPVVVRPPSVPANQVGAVANPGVSVVTPRGAPLASGEYVICQPPGGFVTVPYLPDSMAGGGVVWDPVTDTNVWSWSWAGGPTNDYTIWPNYSCLRMSLTQGTAKTFSTNATANGTMLDVTLPPATILELKFASTPRPDRLNQLEYVQDYHPTDVTNGRHWMVTPSRTLTLIHAVQKPLSPPSATLFINRDYGQTFATHSGDMDSHSRSTGQVDVSGEWIEFIDDITTPGPQYPVTTGRAYSLSIPYGTDDLTFRAEHHEFGDTKHRVIKYTPTATTRYKEFFPPGIINDPTLISVPGTAPNPEPNTFGLFSVPSSARPAAPKVAYIVPTFAWSQAADGSSVRSGGGLRIYLERPWFTSGEGELLAIIVAPPTGALPPETQPFVSMWGRDPVWDSATNGPLTAAAFTNAPGGTVNAVLSENGQPVTILPFQAPIYHPEKQLWYVDVDMNPGQTYFPFVSLALVRYQAKSLEGIEISAVTRADCAQLVPDRTFAVTASSLDTLAVTVTGVAAENFIGPSLATLAGEGGVDIPVAQPKLPAGYVAAPLSHAVVASIQEQAAGAVGDMGWATIGNTVTLVGQMPLGGGTVKWTGTLPVPAPTTGAPRRVLVEEFEIFGSDPLNNDVQLFTPTTERLVYVDTMPVPGFRVVVKNPGL